MLERSGACDRRVRNESLRGAFRTGVVMVNCKTPDELIRRPALG